ncbi:MAG TPA: FecR domain-containing protein [Anaeromyxobacter sp.]
MKRRLWGLLLALLCAAPARGDEPERIGRVRTLEGEVSILRNGAGVPAAVGADLRRGDVVRTGKPGAVGLVLNDETTISLGPGSELALVDFAFAPREGRFALVVRMARGTFAYLAGLIGKLAPGTAQLQLPDATIAMRGTKLLIQVGD